MDQEKVFDSHDMENLGPSQQNSNSKIKKGRGVAVLERLTKKIDGEKAQLVYNSYGQPIGKSRSDFSSIKDLWQRQWLQ